LTLSPQTSKSGFRPDIEGLRAIAIVAVLLCHAGIPFLAGGYVGVDVFFVISGFLITRLLVGEIDRTGSVSLVRFYARRARRLLPLMLVVLAAVGLATALLLSPVRGKEVSGDIVSSALYVANWHFAAQSVDYFAQGVEPSPLQHIWSLAVEEQFYLAWPALLLGVTWLWRRRGLPVRPILWATVAAVFATSLVLGVHLTVEQPNAAYFSTVARAWELALGAMLALLGARRLPGPASVALGWAGLAAIVYAVFAFGPGTPFPGLAALVPTLGAAALILAGSAAAATGAPAGLLSLSPVRYVGRISYAWYLWHWPMLIFAIALWGPLTVPLGIAAIAASWVPTALTHRWVEEPVRLSPWLALKPRRSLALGLGCMVAGLFVASMLVNSQPALHTAPVAEVEGAGALAHQPTPQTRAVALRPNPLWAGKDRSRMYDDGCLVGITGTHSNHCEYGDLSAKRTMFLFGDSHAMQYFPAVVRVARKHHWRLVALAKSECTPAMVTVRSETTGGEYGACDAWREETLRRIESAGRGSTVVISSASDYVPLDEGGDALSGPARTTALLDGQMATLRRLHRAGLRAAVIKDLPPAEDDVPSCVSAKLDDLVACSFPRVRSEGDDVDARAAIESPGVSLVNLTGEICPDVCRAVIGDALVYRDKSHLSATFARTLTPFLERGLEKAGLV
jgi:peptidoglycan/LPS O-acetylase OafA/YrhL